MSAEPNPILGYVGPGGTQNPKRATEERPAPLQRALCVLRYLGPGFQEERGREILSRYTGTTQRLVAECVLRQVDAENEQGFEAFHLTITEACKALGLDPASSRSKVWRLLAVKLVRESVLVILHRGQGDPRKHDASLYRLGPAWGGKYSTPPETPLPWRNPT